jgi:hypothetical protein
MRRLVPFCVAAVAVGFASLGIFGAAADEPKYTIKEVMKEAHKEGLLKKVGSGKASKEEKEKLLALYIALHQNKPAKGDAKDFAKQSQTIVDAAKAVVEGKAGSEGALVKAVNCKNCHSQFK